MSAPTTPTRPATARCTACRGTYPAYYVTDELCLDCREIRRQSEREAGRREWSWRPPEPRPLRVARIQPRRPKGVLQPTHDAHRRHR